MIGREPPDDGILQKGVLYRFRSLPREPEREPDPEVLAVIRRAHEKLVREYFQKKKRAS